MSSLIPLLKFTAGYPHPVVMLIAASIVAAAAALLGQGSGRARLHYAAYVAVCCVVAVVAGSWAMRFIHG